MAVKPKTQKIKAFNGAVTFEMVSPTFYAEAVAAPRIEEFLNSKTEETFFVWEENVIRWPALTVSVVGLETIPGLTPLIEYLRMYKDGAPVAKLLDFWGNNVSKAIYDEWAEVDRKRRDLGIPVVDGITPDATDAEKADPK